MNDFGLRRRAGRRARLLHQFETIDLRSQVWNLLEIGVIVTQRIPPPREVLTNNEP
jgi:hypothetical protein